MEEMGVVTVERFHVKEGESPQNVPLHTGMTLENLIISLKLPEEPEVVMVNGGYVTRDYQLRDGDRVTIMPFLSGG
jgi:sulfur carrier protein ThiS